MTAALPKGAVRLNEPVVKLERTASGVAATTLEGRYEAGAVVVATPPHLAGRIQYEPPMDSLRSQLTMNAPLVRGRAGSGDIAVWVSSPVPACLPAAQRWGSCLPVLPSPARLPCIHGTHTAVAGRPACPQHNAIKVLVSYSTPWWRAQNLTGE